ncbi:YjgP/YjgQ family permease [Aureibaculum marinum]|uniref:YjgP/YjgQ family permease n=1 Tax=Aureibaculum marinum TaxID=2487930 RepID=A0A3N4NMC1_9FLAO|nr:LptF/LptG family permease [Aureibaculum marinum]RPD93240.1 YjgP/YjgQ family permease [Aureibaculum marinum]
MKILNRYILKSFLVPFLATFFIILFVLVMQVLWLQFDKIAGKGIGIGHILQFLGYIAQMQVPLALPIAILLSSIMALGTLAENYEFAAIKSAGISLQRFIRPLVILMVLLSGLNFLFLNYAFPRAAFKFKNMLADLKKTEPALALIPGSFNSEIPGYSIKFDEKYGEDDNFLKNVLIYTDLDKSNFNEKVITAESGEISTEEGSRYMTLTLKNGYRHEELPEKRRNYKDGAKLPATKTYFKKALINIDVSDLSNVDRREYTQDREMLSLKQLNYYSDSLKVPYDDYINSKAKMFLIRTGISDIKNDTTDFIGISPNILDNFDDNNKVMLLNNAEESLKNTLDDIAGFNSVLKNKQKFLNVYDTEYHRRLAFSFACLVLFFIGAPLGSIIRKGGFGFPMIMAILIFVVYFFISTLGRNMAWSSTVTAPVGGWMATLILLPFGIFLMIRATKEKGIFNLDAFLQPITKIFKKMFNIKEKK